MGLADIAEGLEVSETQRQTGVAEIDDTDADLAAALAGLDAALPCEPAVAAELIRAYSGGASVGGAARAAGVPRVTAAKTLHRCGERVAPLSPTGMAVVEDWVDGRLSRAEAMTLADAGPSAFALAAYVATHDPLPGAQAALQGHLAPAGGGPRHRDGMAGALETPDGLR
jgi:hypothetical protein